MKHTVKEKPSKKARAVGALRSLSSEIDNVGLQEIDIEDGELSYMLRKAADLIEKYAPDNLE